MTTTVIMIVIIIICFAGLFYVNKSKQKVIEDDPWDNINDLGKQIKSYMSKNAVFVEDKKADYIAYTIVSLFYRYDHDLKRVRADLLSKLLKVHPDRESYKLIKIKEAEMADRFFRELTSESNVEDFRLKLHKLCELIFGHEKGNWGT